MILFESGYGTVWVLKSDTNMSECNEVNSHLKKKHTPACLALHADSSPLSYLKTPSS